MAIYLTADDADDSLYEMQISKQYVRQLQRFGGKASVLFAEMGEWFGSLWHGKQLAITVGWMTLVMSAALCLLGWWVSPMERD